MSADLEKIVLAALVGLAAWLIRDVAFRLMQQIKDIERSEWEYRLKEIYCPLYFWSGLLAMRLDKKRAYDVCDRLQEVMARAAYAVPKTYYYTLVKLLESVYEQRTVPVADDDRNGMRLYLYNQIEALNLLLYRSEYAGGAGDPIAILSPQRRWLRLLLIGLGHVVTWLLAVIIIGGVLWLYGRRYFDILGFGAVLVLLLLLMYVRRRASIREGLQQRIQGMPVAAQRPNHQRMRVRETPGNNRTEEGEI